MASGPSSLGVRGRNWENLGCRSAEPGRGGRGGQAQPSGHDLVGLAAFFFLRSPLRPHPAPLILLLSSAPDPGFLTVCSSHHALLRPRPHPRQSPAQCELRSLASPPPHSALSPFSPRPYFSSASFPTTPIIHEGRGSSACPTPAPKNQSITPRPIQAAHTSRAPKPPGEEAQGAFCSRGVMSKAEGAREQRAWGGANASASGVRRPGAPGLERINRRLRCRLPPAKRHPPLVWVQRFRGPVQNVSSVAEVSIQERPWNSFSSRKRAKLPLGDASSSAAPRDP